MSFNTVPSTGGSRDLVSTAILNQINVDGVNVKIVPIGTDPNVVYRVGDGTPHPEGWDNVVGQKYLDFYLSRGSYSVGSGTGGQFLEVHDGTKGLQYMNQKTGRNESMVLGTQNNLFAVDSIELEEGTTITIPDGGVFKVL
jgi:hypothetical protein